MTRQEMEEYCKNNNINPKKRIKDTLSTGYASTVIQELNDLCKKNNIKLSEIEIDTRISYDYPEITVTYYVPYTDIELELEINIHKQKCKKDLLWKREQFERLKKELGES